MFHLLVQLSTIPPKARHTNFELSSFFSLFFFAPKIDEGTATKKMPTPATFLCWGCKNRSRRVQKPITEECKNRSLHVTRFNVTRIPSKQISHVES